MTATIAVGRMLRIDEPIFAILAVALVTDLSPRETQQRGLSRISGTVVGSIVGALLSLVLPSNPFSIGFGVLLSMFLASPVKFPADARVAGLVSGIILVRHGGDPWGYALHRSLETMLGIVMAILVSYLPKLLRAEPHVPEEHEAP